MSLHTGCAPATHQIHTGSDVILRDRFPFTMQHSDYFRMCPAHAQFLPDFYEGCPKMLYNCCESKSNRMIQL